jgi:hypothetical protein
MNMNRSLTVAVRSVAAFALLALPGAACLYAQGTTNVALLEQPTSSLLAGSSSSSLPSLDLTEDGIAYSSSTGAAALDAAENYNFKSDDAEQPPPRRRYGRPNYSDQAHNPDGSNKYAFLAGVGLTIPTGNTHKYLNTDYAFQVGAGRNFNKKFAVLLQFDYDHFGFTGSTLYNQSVLYDPTDAYGTIGTLDGKSHVWSFTIDPTYTYYAGDTFGAYVVAGVGFYHKTANFTVPATGEYCDGYYGCYEYEANETIDKYSSNAPGFSGGFGFTYKASRFANERFYAEARYVFVDNSYRPGLTVANENTAAYANYAGNNYFPANSDRTTYIPIKVGLRF